VEKLEEFHKDFVYHEQPGAGHWWDSSPAPGSDCVDWLPLFEFFRRHIRPLKPMSIRFSTPNPGVSASYAWVTIHSQVHTFGFSSVAADADPRIGVIKISTDNVERMELALGELLLQDEAKINIDGVELSAATKPPVYLLKATETGWKVIDPADSWSKGAHRTGPFKLAFDRRMVWVYGTSGSAEENAAILAKVRYDAQVWWYRGNGNVAIVPDREFDAQKYAGRNIILYGNSDTNSVFSSFLKECPIQVDRSEVKVGKKSHQGDIGVLFVYPRAGSDDNLIGVVGMTSLKAVRMNFQARYFISGVACPDYVVFSPDTLSGTAAGILDAGCFDNEWNLQGENK